MNDLTRFSLAIAFTVVGCTGGPSSGSSSASSSSGSPSSNASSGGADPDTCAEFVPGGTTDPAIGGAPESQIIVQAAADLAGVAKKHVVDISASCEDIAVALDAPAASQVQANTLTEPRAKADAWCKIAVAALGAAKAQAGGRVGVQFSSPSCTTSSSDRAACSAKCTSAGCKQACDVRVLAAADCPAPPVTTESSGANPAAAAKLTNALETHLPGAIAIRNQCELEASVVGSFSGTVSGVTDIKAACIGKVAAATRNASDDVVTCLTAASSILDSVR